MYFIEITHTDFFKGKRGWYASLHITKAYVTKNKNAHHFPRSYFMLIFISFGLFSL